MFKFVVLSALVSVVFAAPGYLGGHDYYGYAAAIPAATSYTSRVDVHSKPIVTYTAPVLTKAVVSLPVHSGLYSGYGYGLEGAHGLAYGGYGHDGYGHGSYSHGWY